MAWERPGARLELPQLSSWLSSLKHEHPLMLYWLHSLISDQEQGLPEAAEAGSEGDRLPVALPSAGRPSTSAGLPAAPPPASSALEVLGQSALAMCPSLLLRRSPGARSTTSRKQFLTTSFVPSSWQGACSLTPRPLRIRPLIRGS